MYQSATFRTVSPLKYWRVFHSYSRLVILGRVLRLSHSNDTTCKYTHYVRKKELSTRKSKLFKGKLYNWRYGVQFEEFGVSNALPLSGFCSIRYQKGPSTVRNWHSVRKTASCGTRRIFRSPPCSKQASGVQMMWPPKIGRFIVLDLLEWVFFVELQGKDT